MLKMNLQFFAHKKGVGSTKNGRDSESTDSSLRRETFFILKEAPKFIRATMLVLEETTLYSR